MYNDILPTTTYTVLPMIVQYGTYYNDFLSYKDLPHSLFLPVRYTCSNAAAAVYQLNFLPRQLRIAILLFRAPVGGCGHFPIHFSAHHSPFHFRRDHNGFRWSIDRVYDIGSYLYLPLQEPGQLSMCRFSGN